ncbi:MAG TPA: J domain-containing protein [Flavitalea sp.]|nr:J domain-containing protein [Flavitalea sp.]
MEFIDYYKILNLDKSASDADIKKAYRKLAREHHPDLNPNDKEAHKRFQQINEANEVLSDPEKRKKYDQYGKDWKHAEQFEQARQQQGTGQGFGGGSASYESFDDDRFSDFFESLFGSRNQRSEARYRGQDVQAQLQLTLSEAYQTHQQTFSINGKNVRITVPGGIEDGQVIKLKGHGGPGRNGGPNGDLYITFSIRNDSSMKRDGNDLYVKVPIDLYTAVLGGEQVIDTLGGKLKLKVKPETQNGTKLRVKGKGFPVYKKEGQFGDLYVTYNVQIPTNLTERQKELFRQLSQEK